MEALFEAKVTVGESLTLFNVIRLSPDSYRVEQKPTEEGTYAEGAPKEIVIMKKGGKWSSDDSNYNDIVSIIGTEIDVFNIGYGDLLGRIGV